MSKNINTTGKVSIETSCGSLKAFSDIIYTQAVGPKEKKPKTSAGFAIPEYQEIREDKWGMGGHNIENENDTSYMIHSNESCTVFINMDCKYLKSKILSDPENKKLYEHLWIATCLFFWGPLFNMESAEKLRVKDIFNKSFISIFPLFDLVLATRNVKM